MTQTITLLGHTVDAVHQALIDTGLEPARITVDYSHQIDVILAGGSAGVVRVEPAPIEPAPVELPTGWGARIRATVTCGCGDDESGVPVLGVMLLRTSAPGDSEWRTRDPLPCDCTNVVPIQVGGPDLVTDIVVLDLGDPS